VRRAISGFAFSVALAVRLCAVAPEVGFEQLIGQALPMDAQFTGSDGVSRPLRFYFGAKPTVLVFDYFRCPELCSLVASGATDALRQLQATVGRDYSVIVVSIDPSDSIQMAASRQREQTLKYGREGASSGWHVLLGKAAEIKELADAAGFHFRYDARTRQYAHPSGFVVVTPTGLVSNYFLGIDYKAEELAAAVRRASENKTGTTVFNLVFVCFEGGSPRGQYGRVIWAALAAGVAITISVVFGGIAWMLRNELKTRAGSVGAP
jgi:protein SCO1/2